MPTVAGFCSRIIYIVHTIVSYIKDLSRTGDSHMIIITICNLIIINKTYNWFLSVSFNLYYVFMKFGRNIFWLTYLRQNMDTNKVLKVNGHRCIRCILFKMHNSDTLYTVMVKMCISKCLHFVILYT